MSYTPPNVPLLGADRPEDLAAPATGLALLYPRGGRWYRKTVASPAPQELLSDPSPLYRRWRAALGSRKTAPATIWLVGDSMTEAFGTTTDYEKWGWLFNAAMQQPFRQGGAGFIAATHGTTWPYASNPDGKNAWTLVGHTNDHNYGLGRRSANIGAGDSATITVDADRVLVCYTSGLFTGTMRVNIDEGTSYAIQADTVTGLGASGTMSGRVYESPQLRNGPHTVKVTATSGSIILDGIFVYKEDANLGVQTWEAGHSGHYADAYDDTTGTGDALWADQAYQPAAAAQFADGVGNGTTTFTSATAAFVDNDIGEYIVFPLDNAPSTRPSYGVAKITARASGTSVTLDRICPSGSSLVFRINRSQVTDMVTTNASVTITSATAVFQQWDRGRPIKGTNIPAGAYIRKYLSPTSVEMSLPATGGGSGGTLRIQNRQSRPLNPDLLVIELGINDSTLGYSRAAFKASLVRMVELVAARSCQDVAPSVALLALWAPYGAGADSSVPLVSTQNLSPVITSPDAAFTTADQGKTITGTGIPGGTTIASVQSLTQATMSANATATGTITAIINSRVFTDERWQIFRTAMLEITAEKGWDLIDLYPPGGYIGTNDQYGFTNDGTHPNNQGSGWIADLLTERFGGLPRIASIPSGLANKKGQSFWSRGDDDVIALEPGSWGQVPTARPGADAGVVMERAGGGQRMGYAVPGVGVATWVSVLGMSAPTLSGNASADDNSGVWTAFTTAASINAAAGAISPTFTQTRAGRVPSFHAMIRMVAATTNTRYLIGLFSANPDLLPGTLQGAWFEFDTGTMATFVRCCTAAGSTPTRQLTNITEGAPFAGDSDYDMMVEFYGTWKSNPTGVKFWVNGQQVADITTTLPAAGQSLGYGVRVVTLAAAAKTIACSRMALGAVA